MNRYALFTDVSLNPRLKLGFGAYLIMPSSFLEIPPERIIQPEFVEHIRLRRFEVTSSQNLKSKPFCGLLKISKKNHRVQGSECWMSIPILSVWQDYSEEDLNWK